MRDPAIHLNQRFRRLDEMFQSDSEPACMNGVLMDNSGSVVCFEADLGISPIKTPKKIPVGPYYNHVAEDIKRYLSGRR